jgi:hypothetical protein
MKAIRIIPASHFARIALGTALVLVIPLLAMRFTDEVNWSLSDFVIVGALLFGAGIGYELIASKLSSRSHRLVFGAVIILAGAYIWAELAVGIFTNLGS